MDDEVTVASGYAVGRLWAALETAVSSGDEATRSRAAGKVRQWRAVLDGMADGRLSVGSRTPVAGTPAWVTLEVVHGGFATGRHLAEQPLDDDERLRVRQLPPAPGRTDRERLNIWYLGDEGQAELLAMLADERYRIDLPEHAALPVVALLLDRGRAEAALDLVAELHPFLDRLRLTPPRTDRARPMGDLVHRESVADVVERLRRRRPSPQVVAMQDAAVLWNPLFDALVELWAATVEGELPRLSEDRATVVGGWPARHFPDGWAVHREDWLAWYGGIDLLPMTSRHRHAKSNFARLRSALEQAGPDGAGLTARDVGWVRRALANTVTAHGAPGSESRAALRAAQLVVARRPTHAALARVVADRLGAFPADGGVPDLDPVTVETDEGESPDVPAGQPIPPSVVDTVARALEAPAEELVARGVIPSGEVLAAVLPQVTSRLVSADLGDPVAAGVQARTYAAFRRRRSLLLLDLAHQVRFEELPWVAALRAFRAEGGRATAPAREALRHAALLTLDAWPERIVPNPLLREFGALATQAGLQLPLVEEVAADIFMGTFTHKWPLAAERAGSVLRGSLYARYYDLPDPDFWVGRGAAARAVWLTPGQRPTGSDFAALCYERAVEAGRSRRWSVAANGAVLEQSQILTTHNLAVLMDGLDLEAAVRERAPRLVRQVFGGIVAAQVRLPSGRSALPAIKNMAYAWRQALFLLSLCAESEQSATVVRLAEATRRGPAARLRPAVLGLGHVVAGGRFQGDGTTGGTADGTGDGDHGRRFLGWAVGEHWLLAR